MAWWGSERRWVDPSEFAGVGRDFKSVEQLRGVFEPMAKRLRAQLQAAEEQHRSGNLTVSQVNGYANLLAKILEDAEQVGSLKGGH